MEQATVASVPHGMRKPDAIESTETMGNMQNFNAKDFPSTIRTAKPSSKRFCGPTSPYYSLNAAHIKLSQTSAQGVSDQGRKLPQIDEDHIDDEDDATSPMSQHSSSSSSSSSPPYLRKLFQSLKSFSIREIAQLLRTYHKVIGELHPILNVDALLEQTQAWLKGTKDRTMLDEDDAIILHLALSIAMVAESETLFTVRTSSLASIDELVNARVTTLKPNIKCVKVVLLLVRRPR